MTEAKVVMHYLDDDTDDLEYFKDAVNFTGENIILYTYTKADELLEKINQSDNKNALVILDINMPRKNGFEVLKEIREREKIKGLPVLIYSTSKNQTAINITKDLGANLYIVKPNSFTDLRQIIETISKIDWKDNSSVQRDFLFNLQSQQ